MSLSVYIVFDEGFVDNAKHNKGRKVFCIISPWEWMDGWYPSIIFGNIYRHRDPLIIHKPRCTRSVCVCALCVYLFIERKEWIFLFGKRQSKGVHLGVSWTLSCAHLRIKGIRQNVGLSNFRLFDHHDVMCPWRPCLLWSITPNLRPIEGGGTMPLANGFPLTHRITKIHALLSGV